MNGGMRTAIAVLVVLGTPAVAYPQAAWDVSAMAGVFAGRPQIEGNENRYDDWFHTGQGGITIGRHITRHLKFELDASATGTGTLFVQRFVTVAGAVARYPIGAEAKAALRSVTAAATWQFFDNEWVHPFLTAGVSADFDRRSLHVWQQTYYTGDPRLPGNQILIAPESREGPTTTTATRGLIGGGAKFYVTERAFIRAEGRLTVGAKQQSVAFRAGIGMDF